MARSLSAFLFLEVVTLASALQWMTSLQSELTALPPAHPEACRGENLVTFKVGSVKFSNLGAQGPDTDEPPFIQYHNVTHPGNGNDEQIIDLQIRATSGYAASNVSMNGLYYSYANINLLANTTVDLTFRFIDSVTGAPFEVQHGFFISFFDLDMSGASSLHASTGEFVTVSGFKYMNTTADTELQIKSSRVGNDKIRTFVATQVGTKADNPTHPLGLTSKQMRRAFTLYFPAGKSEFNVSLGAPADTPHPGGRNFLIAGPSSISCPRRAVCSSLQCPSGYDPRPNPEYIACSGEKCSRENDTDVCCCSSTSSDYNFKANGIKYHPSFSAGTDAMVFPDMAPGLHDVVDMRVKNVTAYRAANGSDHHLHYGKINVAANTSTDFEFSFTNRETDEPYELPWFRMSFFDLDEGPFYPCAEEIKIWGLSNYRLFRNTSLTYKREVDNGKVAWVFSAGEPGNGSDNPRDPPLTPTQQEREVSLTFPPLTSFRIKLSVGPGCTTGRNFLFSRPATIGVCDA